MLIVGAGGFAKQLIEVVLQHYDQDAIYCYDEVNTNIHSFLNTFPVLHDTENVKKYFKQRDNTFALGIGTPHLRSQFAHKFESMGGELLTILSRKAIISQFGVYIGNGTCVLDQVIIESNVTIGRAALININALITHDSEIGDFTEISPGAKILGGAKIGNDCFIGAGAIVLPKVIIGDQCTVGAGAVVTKNIPTGEKVIGIPAKRIDHGK